LSNRGAGFSVCACGLEKIATCFTATLGLRRLAGG